jgi:peptide/nickel transport system permease protein
LGRYLAQRLLSLVPVLIGMSLLIFGAMRLLPGDIVDVMVGMQSSATTQQRTAVEHQYGLDRPLPVQYLDWMGRVVRGDLGRSMRTKRSIADDLLRKLPITVELAILSITLAILIAVPLGIVSATRPNSLADLVVRLLGVLGLSIPNFWLAIMLLLVSSRYFGWLPPPIFVPFFHDPLTNLEQMWMPAGSLALVMVANIMRMTRSTMLEVLGQDYVQVARAKGLAEGRVIARHGLRNAAIPIVTLVGMNVGYLLGGAVIVEQIFGLPGIGWMIATSIYQRDYTTVQSVVLVAAVIFAVVNLAVDVLYVSLDPRIRYA